MSAHTGVMLTPYRCSDAGCPCNREVMRTMLFIGIDPGASGGIAYVNEHGAAAYAMPKTERDLWDLLRDLAVDCRCAVIEKVGANRGPDGRRQGASSMFTFGQSYGGLRMALVAAGVSFRDAAPATWLKEFGLRREKDESQTDWKNRHKARAQELFPKLKITHATADALLLAEYCRRRTQP